MPNLNDVLQDTLLMNAARSADAMLIELDGNAPVIPTRPDPPPISYLDQPASFWENQPIWYWEYDPSVSLTRVKNLEVWARGMAQMHPGDLDKAWMTVGLQVDWQPVFVTVMRGANQFRLSLPLTSNYVVRSFALTQGYNDGTNPWWPLEANVDNSFMVVFAYDIANKTSADLPDVVPAAAWNAPNFMPDAGVFVGDPTHHYVVVCLSLVCCKERADFEPAGVLGAGRVYPHYMILSSQPTLEAEAGVSIIRSNQSGYFGTWKQDPAGFRVMTHPDVDPNVGALLMTDTNQFLAGDLVGLVNMPYWDLIFDYYLTDVTQPVIDAAGEFYTPGQPVRMVDRGLRGGRTLSNAVGVLDYSRVRSRALNAVQFVGNLLGSILPQLSPLTPISALLARPSLRLAVPQTLTYKSLHAALYGGDLHLSDFLLAGGLRVRRDVVKTERQGAFDSIHLAPRMKANTLTQPPLDDPKFQLSSISMAPFCEHDCLHTHWRWGKNWADVRLKPIANNVKQLKGFAPAGKTLKDRKFATVGVPYSAVGNPMVPLNQHIDVNFPNAFSFNYAAHITLENPLTPAIDPGIWQPVFHHGSAYSLSITTPTLFASIVTAIANLPSEVSELYWNMRFQATIDGALERLALTPAELRRAMFAAVPSTTHTLEAMLATLSELPQFASLRDQLAGLPPLIANSAVTDNATAVQWVEPNINQWLSALLPTCHDDTPAANQVTLRMLWDAGDNPRLREVRLDWQPVNPQITRLSLPGYFAAFAANTRFGLVFADPAEAASRVVFTATVPAGQVAQASSKFAWERDGLRELHNALPAAGQPVSTTPFFVLNFAILQDTSLLLVDTAYAPDKLPDFFQQFADVLPALDMADPESLRLPTALQPIGLQAAHLTPTLTINAQDFTLPILQREGQPDAQYIRFSGPNLTLPVSFDGSPASFIQPLKLKIINQEFVFWWSLKFNPKTFALMVDHDAGIPFFGANPTAVNPNYLQLAWRFAGLQQAAGVYHFFTLATRNYHYQIQLARGASLELDYHKLSDEPLTFATHDFTITPKGTNLSASVTDKPVRLNGINTRFRFTHGDFSIREDFTRDFTILGAGPLPPALVGDSTVDIALQFQQQAAGIALVASTGSLRGSNRLDCRPTRFRFSVDGLGLKFVEERNYYLYFTLSGIAQFAPDASDDVDGPLALLALIKVDMLECPLAGDTSVLGKYINFLIPLPKLKTFNFLGCFEMELRGFGFVPQAAEFGGDPGMRLSGQIKFAQGVGDVLDARIDLHNLFIGLPAPGELEPRIHLKSLSVNLGIGEAFRLSGVVEFVDEPTLHGFRGEGVLQLQGMPSIAAAFAFMRVRWSVTDPWLRAWFLYAELREVSFMIPVIQIYIREVGLGFGYRYTLTSIKKADETASPRELIKALDQLSRTQGELAKFEQWSVDPEGKGEDPRWTVVLRAMISQMSAAPSPLSYNSLSESDLSSLFLIDAVISFRSDLTFFMAVRAWINTNYADYHDDIDGTRSKPLFTGYVLLSPRQKRFLARLTNNPGVGPGKHPPLPDFVRSAIANSRFSATLLVEPGLFHLELGWPNMLGWSLDLDVLKVAITGGFIFRITPQMLILGTSLIARGELNIDAKFDFGFIGARIYCHARVGFGARQIGLFSFTEPLGGSAIYAAIGLEAQITFGIEAWIEIDLELTSIELSFSFSISINFTASLEQAYDLGSLIGIPALRGSGTVGLSICGHDLHLAVQLAVREEAVDRALRITKDVLNLGLEASEVEELPGMEPPRGFMPRMAVAPMARPPAVLAADLLQAARFQAFLAPAAEIPMAGAAEAVEPYQMPDYSAFVLRTRDADGYVYFVLFPSGERTENGVNGERITVPERGFLPPPPDDNLAVENDFSVTLPHDDDVIIEQYVAADNVGWRGVSADPTLWKANWDAPLLQPKRVIDPATGRDKTSSPSKITLRRYLRAAYLPTGDPEVLPGKTAVSDPRVQNPTDDSFESAVRGAFEQFNGAPFFKFDPKQQYDSLLREAFDNMTTIYAASGTLPDDLRDRSPQQRYNDPVYHAMLHNQQVSQLRGMVVHDLLSNLRGFAALAPDQRQHFIDRSIAFQMGLVFRCKGDALPNWLNHLMTTGEGAAPTMQQRSAPTAVTADSASRPIRTFNVLETDFAQTPPHFDRVRWYSDAGTIAITWDLQWEEDDRLLQATPAQREPEHHLAHYRVQRRPLSSSEEREVVYTIRPAAALHRRAATGADGVQQDVLYALRPRFQIVDHFDDHAHDDLAALPAEGRSYLYSITPVDVAGHAGRPLTLIATRRPTLPPPVPLDAEITVRYQIDAATAGIPAVPTNTMPAVIVPTKISVAWTEAPERVKAAVPAREYVVVFRREPTLPIGSYGLDNTTQTPPARLMSSSNARPLPTDVKIVVPVSSVDKVRDTQHLTLSTADLVSKGVLPNDRWQPTAWHVFIQAVGKNGVPSALAPVSIQLEIHSPESGEAAEKRRPALLEWLPMPLRLPALPPEDEAAEVGFAHMPMPVQPRFTPDLAGVSFQAHPARIRAVRFRWNQGPSSLPDYPLEQTAGYRLAELDVDAHTSATFADNAALQKALRDLQDVQMLPPDQLLLTPADTLSTSQWEAWYASDWQRPMRADGSKGAWYSWRESYLEFPPPGDPLPGRAGSALHPLLARIIERIQRPDPARAAETTVAVQAQPPTQPADLAALFANTPSKSDPYGWNILQRFGLSLTFTVHDQLGRPVSGAALLNRLQAAITSVASSLLNPASLTKFLHVELLYQPGKSLRLHTGSTNASELLALIQISLRPAIHQDQAYIAVLLNSDHGLQHQYLVTAAEGASILSAEDATPLDAPPKQPTTMVVRLPDTPKFDAIYPVIRYRGSALPEIAVQVSPGTVANPAQFNAIFNGILRYSANGTPRIVMVDDPKRLNIDQLQFLKETLQHEPPAVLNAILAYQLLITVDVTDWRTRAFIAPLAFLAQSFASGQPGTEELKRQWQFFKRYAEASGSNDPKLPPSAKIRVPTVQADIEKILPDFLSWSQRFFDASAPVTVVNGKAVSDTAGPWTATAYLRAATPAYTSPDETNRLTYVHLIEDRWAHIYRYYIQPYSRYDLLWRSLRQSTTLFATPAETPALRIEVDAADGGLDVTIERTQAVAMPLILSSRRLDEPATPAHPPVPGRTWEVIVARHPEQALIERNSTLARQLSYRQIAFTLLRRFKSDYDDWRSFFPQELQALRMLQDIYPPAPSSFPDQLDHIDLTQLDADTLHSLDLPDRLGAFQQGALVLQWEGLPFYYEHRLMLIAQTDSTVSPVNSTIQSDFAYRSPLPSAFLGVADGFRIYHVRVLRIPVRQLWDSLPDQAQAHWTDERPDAPDSPEPARKPGALPDFDVTYQLVDVFGGNIEVEHEIYFDLPTDSKFMIRSLGDHFSIDYAVLERPAEPQGLFYLYLAVPEVTRLALTSLRFRRGVPQWPAGGPPYGVSLEAGGVLVFKGALTDPLLSYLINFVRAAGGASPAAEQDIAALTNMYSWWTRQEPISTRPVGAPNVADVRFVPAKDMTLVWDGVLTAEDETALNALPGDEAFTAAVQTLIAQVKSADPPGKAVYMVVPRGFDVAPAAVAAKIVFQRDAATNVVTGLTWNGALFDAEAAALREWAKPIPTFAAAVEKLVQQYDALSVEVPGLPLHPPPQLPIPFPLLTSFAAVWEGHVHEEGGSFFWKGRVATPADLSVLEQLVPLIGIIPLPGPFTTLPAALAQILNGLQATAEVAFDAPAAPRPTQAELGTLREKLMIATWMMQYQGHMTPDDARLLIDALAEAVDKRAVTRLYEKSLFSGEPGRESKIRTRRGSAAPSDLQNWQPMPLAAD
jgi:hypothetical protein